MTYEVMLLFYVISVTSDESETTESLVLLLTHPQNNIASNAESKTKTAIFFMLVSPALTQSHKH